MKKDWKRVDLCKGYDSPLYVYENYGYLVERKDASPITDETEDYNSIPLYRIFKDNSNGTWSVMRWTQDIVKGCMGYVREDFKYGYATLKDAKSEVEDLILFSS